MSNAAIALPTDIDEIVFDDDRDTTESKRPEGFVVDTQDKATWAARRYLQAEHRIKERDRLAKEYKAKIDSWLERANKGDLTIGRLIGAVEAFRGRVALPTSSAPLGHGRVASRAGRN